MSAAERAILIPELLEQVLVQLPVEELLKVKLVNKYFQDVVSSSPVLRQHMFVDRTPAEHTEEKVNPLLLQILNRYGSLRLALYCGSTLQESETINIHAVFKDLPIIDCKQSLPSAWRTTYATSHGSPTRLQLTLSGPKGRAKITTPASIVKLHDLAPAIDNARWECFPSVWGGASLDSSW